MVIHIADDDEVITQVFRKNLPADWRTIAAYSSLQRIGSAWYQSLDSVVLKVPSAVIPHEYNYVINTEHPQFAKSVKHVGNEPYFWDERSEVK